MITSRITFVLEHDGLAGWQLQELKQLTDYFHSLFVFYNITRSKQATLNESLRIMSLGSCRHDLCQLAIEGLDAELACIVFTEYLREHATLVSTSHKPNHHAKRLLTEHPAFQLPFVYDWHYQRSQNLPDKRSALTHIAALANPNATSDLLTQLLAREYISSTAMAGGIALPHVVSEHIQRPCFIVFSLDEGLDWQSAHEPVHLVCAVLLPAALHREWLIAVTRLTRWFIADTSAHLLRSARREETIESIVLHVMAHYQPS
ncbi:PTS sugar transporter subunit IIA [Vibrio furnissii]|nr:PTS sugar transporter subunit IIA [Vibrio furnissii]QTG97180.1 PTS sugar transporter subunit IIA [Vibrio furnissii]